HDRLNEVGRHFMPLDRNDAVSLIASMTRDCWFDRYNLIPNARKLDREDIFYLYHDNRLFFVVNVHDLNQGSEIVVYEGIYQCDFLKGCWSLALAQDIDRLIQGNESCRDYPLEKRIGII